MRFSMWIFVEALNEYELDVDITSGKMEIDSVRLFSKELQPERGKMYIGRKCDIFSGTQTDVICAHGNDIIIVGCDDLNEILNKILSVVECYTKWANALINMTTKGAMLSDLIRISQDILPYPIILLDSAQKAIAYSENFALGEVDEDFDSVLSHGTASLEKISSFNKEHPDLFKQRGIFYMDDSFWPTDSYSYNLYEGTDWIGIILIIDHNGTCNQGIIDTFYVLAEHIQQWFHLHGQGGKSSQFENVFRKALNNDEAAYREMSRFLTLNGWNECDGKCLIKLYCPSNIFNMHTHLCKNLRTSIEGICAVTFDNAVIVLCNLSQKKISRFQLELEPWLKKCDYFGCQSEIFTDFSLLYQYYLQTCITQEKCPQDSGKIYHILPYIMSYGAELVKEISPISLIHPALETLKQYDRVHHSELLKTLHMYLINNCNQQQTAKDLSLHRNSLIYRLQRMEELIDIDYADALERMHLLYSLEYLI